MTLPLMLVWAALLVLFFGGLAYASRTYLRALAALLLRRTAVRLARLADLLDLAPL